MKLPCAEKVKERDFDLWVAARWSCKKVLQLPLPGWCLWCVGKERRDWWRGRKHSVEANEAIFQPNTSESLLRTVHKRNSETLDIILVQSCQSQCHWICLAVLSGNKIYPKLFFNKDCININFSCGWFCNLAVDREGSLEPPSAKSIGLAAQNYK